MGLFNDLMVQGSKLFLSLEVQLLMGVKRLPDRQQLRQVVCTAGRVFEGGLGSGKTVGAWEVFWVDLITLWRAILSAAVYTMKPYVRLLSLMQLLFQLHFPNKSQESVVDAEPPLQQLRCLGMRRAPLKCRLPGILRMKLFPNINVKWGMENSMSPLKSMTSLAFEVFRLRLCWAPLCQSVDFNLCKTNTVKPVSD